MMMRIRLGKRIPPVLPVVVTPTVIFVILLMIEILHYLKDPKLWELWYVPYNR